MSGFEKHPILANGEYYITPLEKRIGGGNITRPHEYFEAKQRLLSNIDSIQAEIEKEKEIFVKEKVVCVRLEPKYEAKSYVPTSLIATVYKGNIIKNLIMDCQSYTKYRPNETTGGIFVSWRRKEELPTGA